MYIIFNLFNFYRDTIIYLLLQSLKAFNFFVSVYLQIFLDELKSWQHAGKVKS